MPSIYQLKPAFQNLLRPLAGHLAKTGVTANQITLTGFFLSSMLGASIWLYPQTSNLLLVMPLFQLFRMALNAIDGMMAREFNMKTPLGAILNELTDVLADSALYYPFCRIFPSDNMLIAPTIILFVIAEMTGVIAVQIGASRRYDGPFGKGDRAFIFGILALLTGLKINISSAINYIFTVMIILSIITIFNRAKQALIEIQI
jgi:CDP-diacylglycerol--glycerol-3-phosphate 3-phosphatidyltransferase